MQPPPFLVFKTVLACNLAARDHVCNPDLADERLALAKQFGPEYVERWLRKRRFAAINMFSTGQPILGHECIRCVQVFAVDVDKAPDYLPDIEMPDLNNTWGPAP